MSVIEKKIDAFTRNDINNGFKAVDWCVEHGLYQQAVTMLLENMLTCILAEEGVDWGVANNRNAASAAIKLISSKSISLDKSREDAELIASLMKNPIVLEFASEFEALRELRNDINHGGYLTELNKKARKADSIMDRFQRICGKINRKLWKRGSDE